MADHHLTLFQPGEGGKVCPPFYNIHPITKDIRKYFQGHPFIHYEYVQLFGNYVVYLQSAVSYYSWFNMVLSKIKQIFQMW